MPLSYKLAAADQFHSGHSMPARCADKQVWMLLVLLDCTYWIQRLLELSHSMQRSFAYIRIAQLALFSDAQLWNNTKLSGKGKKPAQCWEEIKLHLIKGDQRQQRSCPVSITEGRLACNSRSGLHPQLSCMGGKEWDTGFIEKISLETPITMIQNQIMTQCPKIQF